ncbi:TPA: hypothetical protein ACGMCE_001711 [Streptococcus agalactiae]
MVKNRQTEIKLSHELFKIIRSHALKECDPKEKRKKISYRNALKQVALSEKRLERIMLLLPKIEAEERLPRFEVIVQLSPWLSKEFIFECYDYKIQKPCHERYV